MYLITDVFLTFGFAFKGKLTAKFEIVKNIFNDAKEKKKNNYAVKTNNFKT